MVGHPFLASTIFPPATFHPSFGTMQAVFKGVNSVAIFCYISDSNLPRLKQPFEEKNWREISTFYHLNISSLIGATVGAKVTIRGCSWPAPKWTTILSHRLTLTASSFKILSRKWKSNIAGQAKTIWTKANCLFQTRYYPNVFWSNCRLFAIHELYELPMQMTSCCQNRDDFSPFWSLVASLLLQASGQLHCGFRSQQYLKGELLDISSQSLERTFLGLNLQVEVLKSCGRTRLPYNCQEYQGACSILISRLVGSQCWQQSSEKITTER